jgi:hypothetical protein
VSSAENIRLPRGISADAGRHAVHAIKKARQVNTIFFIKPFKIIPQPIIKQEDEKGHFLFRKCPKVHAHESVEKILEKQIILQDER